MKARYYILSALATVILSGCNAFLDSDNLTKKDNSNFPKTEEDAAQSLTGCYAMLRDEGDSKINQNLMIISEILSDDRFGGGGPDDRYAQALDHLKKSDNNMFDDVWSVNYKGIYRCNMLLESLGNITFDSAADKNQIEGETRFLRAFYYFNLCKTFGNVPLIVTSQSKNPTQAPADSLYKQIGTDLQKAVALLPATKIADMQPSRLGHVNLIDNIDFIFARLRRNTHLFDQCPNIIHRIIRGGIQFVDIERTLFIKRTARFAFIASLAFGIKIRTVDGFGKNSGTSRFTHATRSAKQVGMSQLTSQDSILQGGSKRPLSHYRFESRRAILQCRNNIIVHLEKYLSYHAKIVFLMVIIVYLNKKTVYLHQI